MTAKRKYHKEIMAAKVELAIPAEPLEGPLREAYKLIEIREMYQEEVRRFDQTVYAHQRQAINDMFVPDHRWKI